jgi:hypothetical protein
MDRAPSSVFLAAGPADLAYAANFLRGLNIILPEFASALVP